MTNKMEKLPKQYLIRCSSKYENNYVMKLIYNKDNYANGHHNFIMVYKDGFKGAHLWDSNNTNYPEFTFEKWKQLFEKQNEFVFPDKWCIKQNTDRIVCNWFNKKYGVASYISGCYTYLVNHSDLDKSIYSNVIPKGYVEITFEQFKKYELKQETMGREIIGYKIKEQYVDFAINLLQPKNFDRNHFLNAEINFTNSDNRWYNTILKAGVLDIWFEPVYGEEFKVGDWVTLNNESNIKYNHVGQITELDIQKNIYWWGTLGYSSGAENLRKATPEEIEEATTIKIGDYEAEFEGKIVSFNGVGYDFSELIILRDLMNRNQIKSLNVGCNSQHKVDLELINKILKKMQ
jgi:hypothetical protein